jgi:hypothetical protein
MEMEIDMTANPVLDADRHTDKLASYSEQMQASEIARATEMRVAIAKCDPNSIVLGKTKTQIVACDWPYRSRPEFLHESMTSIIESYPAISCKVMQALMLAARRGVIEAQEACEVIAVQFGIENAEVDS